MAKEAFRLSGEQVRFEEREYRLAALYDEALRPALLEDLAQADILLGRGMFDPDEVEPLITALQQRRPDVVMLAEGFGPNAAGNGSKVRSLEEKLRVESRTRLLNPKWYEGLLEHGYQGVHEIATRLDNTYGWAATVEASVDEWIFDSAADTYLLDEAMRQRLAELNPHASQRMAGRLLEASERGLWQTESHRLEQLREVYAEFEDAIEVITQPKVKEGQPS